MVVLFLSVITCKNDSAFFSPSSDNARTFAIFRHVEFTAIFGICVILGVTERQLFVLSLWVSQWKDDNDRRCRGGGLAAKICTCNFMCCKAARASRLSVSASYSLLLPLNSLRPLVFQSPEILLAVKVWRCHRTIVCVFCRVGWRWTAASWPSLGSACPTRGCTSAWLETSSAPCTLAPSSRSLVSTPVYNVRWEVEWGEKKFNIQ